MVSVVSDLKGVQSVGVLVDFEDEIAGISGVFWDAVLSLTIFYCSIEIILIDAFDTGEAEPGEEGHDSSIVS